MVREVCLEVEVEVLELLLAEIHTIVQVVQVVLESFGGKQEDSQTQTQVMYQQ
jgi:hypothetical protein